MSPTPPSASRGEIIEDDGEAHTKVVEFLAGLKVI